MALVTRYRDLKIWKLGMEVAKEIYHITETFPRSEQFGLVSQMRRAAVSIPSNIAEGFGRRGKAEMKHFLSIAQGSIAELDTQLILAEELGLMRRESREPVARKINQLARMTTQFSKRL